jgi:glycosyltransferase involved in cell wall biosynthesis
MTIGQTAKRMHVVWVHPRNFYHVLDAATYLDTTRELRKLGCDVTLVSAGPDGIRQCRGVEVLCISQPDVYFVRQMLFHLKAARWILGRWGDVDIVLFHEISTLWLLPLRLLRWLRRSQRPLLVMDTRTMMMAREDTVTSGIRLRRLFVGAMMWMGNRWADGRTAITRRMAEVLNVPQQKLWGVWPSGVQPELFAEAQTLRRWPAPDEPVHIIYVGAIQYERRLKTFCEAVVRARADGMNFVFTLVGDGRERKDLEAFAARYDFIHMKPPVPHQEIPHILAGAHIGVLPFPDETKFQVSSPIKLFEYMASGMPILATKIACHTDVISSDGCIFWAQPGEEGLLDALRRVWASRAELPAMGAHADRSVHEWTWKAAAEKLKRALEYGSARET